MRSRPIAAFLIMGGFLGMIWTVSGCGSLPGDAAVKVNGTIITKQDVDRRIDNLRKTYSSMMPAEDEGDAFTNLRREVADKLVMEELLKQETAKQGITVSPEEIDQRLQEIADDKFLGELSKLFEESQNKGLTVEDIRADLGIQILDEKMKAEIGKDIQVTDQDALDYYERNKAQYVQPERRQVRQIVTDNEAAAFEAANRAHTGEDFLGLVTQFSIDPEAGVKKGALGLVSPGQLPPELDRAVYSSAINAVSGPIKLGEQWYVLRVEFIVPAASTSFEEAKEDIIILYGGQQYSERWRAFVEKVYDDATIEFDRDYDPQFKTETAAAAPVQ